MKNNENKFFEKLLLKNLNDYLFIFFIPIYITH